MVLLKLSYFDTGCLKKVKTEEKIWFPHNYKQPDQILKQRCVKKVITKKRVFKGTLPNNFVTRSKMSTANKIPSNNVIT